MTEILPRRRDAAPNRAVLGGWWHENGSLTPRVGWLTTLLFWIERSRQRRALGELAMHNDSLLKDIGVSQEQARREAAKPFWRQ